MVGTGRRSSILCEQVYLVGSPSCVYEARWELINLKLLRVELSLYLIFNFSGPGDVVMAGL